jgi:putative transposase
MEQWRRDYNEVRPHSAIGNNPPAALQTCSRTSVAP